MRTVQGCAGAQQCFTGQVEDQAALGGRDIDGAAAAPAGQYIGKYAARPHVGDNHRAAVSQRLAGRDGTLQHKAELVGFVPGHQQQLALGVAANPRGKAGHQRVQLRIGQAAQKAGAAHDFIVGCVVHTAPCVGYRRVSCCRCNRQFICIIV